MRNPKGDWEYLGYSEQDNGCFFYRHQKTKVTAGMSKVRIPDDGMVYDMISFASANKELLTRDLLNDFGAHEAHEIKANSPHATNNNLMMRYFILPSA